MRTAMGDARPERPDDAFVTRMQRAAILFHTTDVGAIGRASHHASIAGACAGVTVIGASLAQSSRRRNCELPSRADPDHAISIPVQTPCAGTASGGHI
jgi:hypothetical protein